MEKISLEIFKKEIDYLLEKQSISGRYILDRFSLINEISRKSPAYLDPKYAPFYYYLGKCINPKTMMEIGFDLGLLSSSFLISCKTVENFFGFKEKTQKNFFSNRIGITNIKKYHKKEKEFFYGEIFEKDFEDKLKNKKWDLIIINEEKDYDKQLQYIETVWPHIDVNGMLVIEYIETHKPSKEAFKSFVENKEAKNLKFNTRYGTGILFKNEI